MQKLIYLYMYSLRIEAQKQVLCRLTNNTEGTLGWTELPMMSFKNIQNNYLFIFYKFK